MRQWIVAVAAAVFFLSASFAQAREAETDFALAFVGGLGVFLGALQCMNSEDEGSDYSRSGIYAGLGGTFAIEEVVKARGVTADNSAGLNARVGYRCDPLVSLEFAYEWIDGFDVSVATTGVPATINFKADRHVFTANAKLHVLRGPVQPYVLAGLGVMRGTRLGTSGQLEGSMPPTATTNKQAELAPRLGGGIDGYINENAVVSFEASYLRGTYKLRGLDHVTLGLSFQYRF